MFRAVKKRKKKRREKREDALFKHYFTPLLVGSHRAAMHGHHARIMYKYKREALVNSNIVLTPGCSARNKCMSTEHTRHELLSMSMSMNICVKLSTKTDFDHPHLIHVDDGHECALRGLLLKKQSPTFNTARRSLTENRSHQIFKFI